MGNKGLSMHSFRSPVYGKTLACCTGAVYPPRFLQTTPRWEASVFHVLWLGHMYMGNKGLPMHSSRSPVYGETLARCPLHPCETLAPRFIWTTSHRWDSVFHRLFY
jgi:hypothetical protein